MKVINFLRRVRLAFHIYDKDYARLHTIGSAWRMAGWALEDERMYFHATRWMNRV